MPSKSQPGIMALEGRIRSAAYVVWPAEGKPDGRADVRWFRAMQTVSAEAIPDFLPKRVTRTVKPRKKAASVQGWIFAAPGAAASAPREPLAPLSARYSKSLSQFGAKQLYNWHHAEAADT